MVNFTMSLRRRISQVQRRYERVYSHNISEIDDTRRDHLCIKTICTKKRTFVQFLGATKQASKQEGLSVRPSIRPSVRP